MPDVEKASPSSATIAQLTPRNFSGRPQEQDQAEETARGLFLLRILKVYRIDNISD